jgi:hypothetical protein
MDIVSQYFAEIFVEWEILQTKVVEKNKEHISFLVTFSESRDFYKIMWKNIVDLERPQMVIQYNAFALNADN